MRKVVGNDVISFIVAMVLCLGAGMLVNTSQSQARSKVALSRTKKSYDMTGLWDKIKLKNAPSRIIYGCGKIYGITYFFIFKTR